METVKDNLTRIKEQINELVRSAAASAETLEELQQAEQRVAAHIYEGLQKMKNSGIWSINETDEISKYSKTVKILTFEGRSAVLSEQTKKTWIF